MASRFLVLFAREPRRQALDKGLAGEAGEGLFTAFADGWIDAARRSGAQVVVATPAVDRTAWRRRLPSEELRFLEQRGKSFGERLEDTARQAADLGGHAILVGGDVAPSPSILAEAFELLEGGADAVIAPARDGGVSLVALRREDLDLLGSVALRRTDVFSRLSRRLSVRGRQIGLVAAATDVDGRRRLRSLLRSLPAALRNTARKALSLAPTGFREPRALSLRPERARPRSLRGPPRAA